MNISKIGVGSMSLELYGDDDHDDDYDDDDDDDDFFKTLFQQHILCARIFCQ
jgi:hypothetical protein